MSISVVGLGKLGLCTATCFACEGIPVIGYDNDSKRISLLGEHKCYIDEPGLEDKLNEAFVHHQFAVTDDIQTIIEHTDQTFIVVPTPSDEYGWFSNAAIMDVLNKMIPYLRTKQSHHIINIVSTVMPGTCNKFISYIEDRTGKVVGKDFDITYNPEFIAIGDVIRGFLHPDMVLIGSSNESGNKIAENYRSICDNIQSMSLINAEITKLSLNCFLTAKISFVNELATICEMTPGANIDPITQAIGQDSRIGNKLMKAGLGVGGPCLPRDVIALSAYAGQKGYDAKFPVAIGLVNKGVVGRILSKILCHVPSNGIIDIYGLSYKDGTSLTEGSQSIILRDELTKMGYFVRTFEEKPEYAEEKYPFAIVVMSESIDVDTSILGEKCLLIDPWRRFPEARKHCIYYGLGVNNGYYE